RWFRWLTVTGFVDSYVAINRSDIAEPLHPAPRPLNRDRAHSVLGAQAEQHAFVARRHEPDADRKVVVERPARGGGHFDARSNSVPVTPVADEFQPQPLVPVTG